MDVTVVIVFLNPKEKAVHPSMEDKLIVAHEQKVIPRKTFIEEYINLDKINSLKYKKSKLTLAYA